MLQMAKVVINLAVEVLVKKERNILPVDQLLLPAKKEVKARVGVKKLKEVKKDEINKRFFN